MTNRLQLAIDLWTYKDFVEFSEATQKNDSDAAFALAQRLISWWDYSIPLETPDALWELGVAESAEVIRTIWNTLTEYAANADVKAVKVDFSKWNTRKFYKWDALRRDGKTEEVERLLHEIASLEGVDPTKPLTFAQGSLMLKAVNEKYKQIVTGKN